MKDREHREFVFQCEHISGDVWTVEHQWAIEDDAQEIVRCRDCERFSQDHSDHECRSGWWCHRWNTDMVKPDGFCAWGKRR